MSDTNKQPTPQNLQQQVLKAGLLSGLVSGCAIILILAVALGVGLWLDSTLSDGRRVYTFISILVSVPVTFVVVFYLSRWLSVKMAPAEPEKDNEARQEQ